MAIDPQNKLLDEAIALLRQQNERSAPPPSAPANAEEAQISEIDRSEIWLEVTNCRVEVGGGTQGELHVLLTSERNEPFARWWKVWGLRDVQKTHEITSTALAEKKLVLANLGARPGGTELYVARLRIQFAPTPR